MPLLDIFWTMLMLFLWIAWFWVLISVVVDIFRNRESSGFQKALWTLFVIVIPWLGVLVYLIANGDDMTRREAASAAALQQQQADYIRSVAGTGTGAAEQLEKLAGLRDRGVISEQEFQTEKAKVLG
jgi:hypothetical protein